MGATLDLDRADALPTSLDKLGVDNLLLTLGAEGMVLFTKDKQIHRIPTMAREVFDVSGAGDTVTAWVGAALAAGASVREAAQVANYAAGVEVGKLGVATVSPAAVLAAHDTRYDQLGKLRRGRGGRRRRGTGGRGGGRRRSRRWRTRARPAGSAGAAEGGEGGVVVVAP